MSDCADAIWPTEGQEMLLRAALLRGPSALEAWETWKSRHDLVESHLDRGSFRLLPLLYKNLIALGADEPELARLKGLYRFAWCANQKLFHESALVLRELSSAGVRTIVLKGAALSALYYKDAGARPMADIDILVPVAQVSAAVDAFARAGWRTTSRRLGQDIRFRHSAQFLNGTGQELDLHWHAFCECLGENSDADFWSHAVPLRILNGQTQALDATDSLLHTIVHGIRWNPEPSIRWIPDAMAILRAAGEEIRWDRLLDQTRERQMLLRLGKGLKYLREKLEAPIPAAVLERAASVRPTFVERVEYRYISLGPEERGRLFFGHYSIMCAEYLRFAAGKSALRKAIELFDYLRYRQGLDSRRHVPLQLLRHTWRKLKQLFVGRPSPREPMPSSRP